MLYKTSESVRLCLEHADDCRRRALDTVDAQAKQDFLNLDRRWRLLAESYDFVDRLDNFLGQRT